MVAYSVEATNEILLPVHQVPGQPTFCTLCQLYQELQEFLGKVVHLDHTDEGYSGYMMMKAAYALYSTTRWKDPADVGNYFIVPMTDITHTDQKYKESK